MRRFVRKNPIPPQYLEDYTFVKRLAKLRWYFFEIFASDTMKNDRELMKELIREKQVFFRYASELLRSDRELIEIALDIGDCGNDIHKVWKKLSHSDCIHDGLVQLFRYPKRVLKYCTDEKLREDKELIFTATQFKSNRELVKQAVSYHGAILAYLDNKFKLDQEIALIALNTSPNRLWDVSPLVRNTLDFSINVADTQGSRWIFETYYKSQGEEFWSIAIQKRMLPSTLLPTNIYNDNNLMRIVLERDPSLLELCSDEIRDDFELVKIAVSHDIKNIRYASNRIRSSDETTSMLITLYPRIILYLEDNIKQNPKYYSLTGDLENMTVFKNAPYCIRNNANLSENFIKLDIGMFQYVSEELKNSRDFVWKIFSYNESILQYGSEELRNDFDFMSLCIEKNPLLFSHLSSNLRGNIEIIRLAIETAITNKVSAKQLRSNIIVHILAKDNETSLIDLYRMCSNNYENEKFLLLYFASPVLLFNEDFVLKEASKLTNDAWDFLKLFKRAVSEYEYIVAAAIILLDPTLYEHAYSFVCHSFPKDLAPSILYYLGEDHAPIVSDLFISKAIPVPLFGILSEYLRYYCASTLIAHKVPILEFVPNLMVTTDNLCSLLPKYLSCEDKILVHILKYSNNIDFFKKIFEIYYSSQFTKLIKYASEGLRNDSNLMAQAIRCDPTNLQYASATLKSNRDLVALAVRLQPESFAYAAEELKNDFEYIKSISHSYNEVLLYNLATRNVRMNYLQKVRSKK
ncbi:predicted protein [Naegleria gruberi]|uniref:Predicted protein n=1 Tax=Naegleria gruberi TaxID=5762 RepID=D2V4C2_NAEGR|nr:uncharacterized protein NAEGRDRAFT_63672 [Naegleria gruberi]EFC48491.1 predicted protein [Naegleria gruberi]|eukprot:XP_002681235.1 predicted protein [Naegleria gruberi strain NEG-M]